MQRSQRCLASVIAALTLLSPSAALAQVTFDNGPSSKEYAIPLDSARGQTKTKAPKPKPQTPAPATTTPAPAATSTTPRSATAKKTSAEKAKGTTTTTTTAQSVAPVTTTPDPPATGTQPASTSSSGGSSARIVIAGLALAVLALGGLAGLVLRRRRQPLDEF